MKINFNEGGRVLTIFVDTGRRIMRIWFKPGFYLGGRQFERVWRWK